MILNGLVAKCIAERMSFTSFASILSDLRVVRFHSFSMKIVEFIEKKKRFIRFHFH